MIRFDDGISSWSLGTHPPEDEVTLSEREIRRVLARWLTVEPWGTQLRSFIEQEIRVEARTNDALLDRVYVLLGARRLALSLDERVHSSGGTEAAIEQAAEPLRAMTREDDEHWIHVIVVDQDDRPAVGVGYRLELTDGRVRTGRTNAEGAVHVDEIPAGSCRFSAYVEPSPTKRPVRQGECVSTMASRSGVPWRTIWDAPENEPLRAAGREPNVLLPGDELHVPRHELADLSLATDRQHRVVVEGLTATVHIKLVASLEPLPDEPWTIEHPSGTLEGRSDGEGKLEAKLPALLERATLLLPARRQRYTLLLGALNPISTPSGAWARLRNLGIAAHDRADEQQHAETLREFQRSQELDESAELDDATIEALRAEYGI